MMIRPLRTSGAPGDERGTSDRPGALVVVLIEKLLGGALDLLRLLLEQLPDLALPVDVTTLTGAVATVLGYALGMLAPYVNVGVLVPVVSWVLTSYLPFAVSYRVVTWVYARIPVIGKGNG